MIITTRIETRDDSGRLVATTEERQVMSSADYIRDASPRAYADRAAAMFDAARAGRDAGRTPGEQAELFAALVSDPGGEYLAASVIVKVWDLDHDSSASVRRALYA